MLQGIDPVRRFFVRKRLDLYFGLGELRFLDPELSKIESGNRLRSFTLPDTDILSALVGIADARARSSHLHAFRNPEGHVVGGILTESGAHVVGIPVLTRNGEIIAAALVDYCFLAAVGRCHGELFACSQ